MAQHTADKRKRYRVKPRVQGRFNVEPGRNSVRLPMRGHLARESPVGRAINRESKTNPILIEKIRQQLEVTDEENDRGQRHVKGACDEQPAQWFRRQASGF